MFWLRHRLKIWHAKLNLKLVEVAGFFVSQNDIGKMPCKPEETLATSLNAWEISFVKSQ